MSGKLGSGVSLGRRLAGRKLRRAMTMKIAVENGKRSCTVVDCERLKILKGEEFMT